MRCSGPRASQRGAGQGDGLKVASILQVMGAAVFQAMHGSQTCFMPTQAFKETTMQWTAPAFTDLRFGFEITMYIANR